MLTKYKMKCMRRKLESEFVVSGNLSLLCR